MKYTVAWLPSALLDLADIWNNAADRRAVTEAADTIDDWLIRDPLGQGEGREGTMRILFNKPLAISYGVDTVNRMVYVWEVWRYPP
jgi:hypothetical protein